MKLLKNCILSLHPTTYLILQWIAPNHLPQPLQVLQIVDLGVGQGPHWPINNLHKRRCLHCDSVSLALKKADCNYECSEFSCSWSVRVQDIWGVGCWMSNWNLSREKEATFQWMAPQKFTNLPQTIQPPLKNLFSVYFSSFSYFSDFFILLL